MSALSTSATSSDAHLVAAVADVLATPRASLDPSSFVLHAPLELLARRALLPLVRDEARSAARERITEIATKYAAEDEAAPEPTAHPSEALAPALLVKALEEGLPEAAVAALDVLLATHGTRAVRALAFDLVLDRLGAAGHAPILFAELLRVVDRVPGAGRLLRAPIRVLAAEPAARLSWHAGLDQPARANADRTNADTANEEEACAQLRDRLAAPAHVSSKGSIAPTMMAVEQSGQARALLADLVPALRPDRAARELFELAAWSMLQDSPNEAPYGWSHCLTLPLGVLGNVDVSARPQACIAVAATHVLGFRATLGKTRIEPGRAPERVTTRSIAGAEPGVAASVMWHAELEERGALVTTLATRAAVHRDAHLVKYTLACLDLADRHAAEARLYLAAAAYLGAWWEARDARS